MLIVVSPAKTLDYTSPFPPLQGLRTTRPRLLDDSAVLIKGLKRLSPTDISALMGVSDKIAALNTARFAEWQQDTNREVARPAVFAFRGDVYTGLDIDSFDGPALAAAQQRLRILSGLYGLLRPLDMMRPYRLEMGTRYATKQGKDLYAFWDDRVTKLLKQDMKAADTEILVNLASNEYFRAVKPAVLDARIITPVFEDEKKGQYKVISFYAKKARGLMAAWILREQVKSPEALRDFNVAGYRFHSTGKQDDTLIFRRREADA